VSKLWYLDSGSGEVVMQMSNHLTKHPKVCLELVAANQRDNSSTVGPTRIGCA
jgi:hypothetical protein